MAKKVVAPLPAPTPGPAETEPIIYSLHKHIHNRSVGSSFGDILIDRHGFVVNFYTLRQKMAVRPPTPEEFLARATGFADARSLDLQLVNLWDLTREERDKARAIRDAAVKVQAPAIVPNAAPGRVVMIDPMTGKAQDQEFVGRVQDLTGTGHDLPSQTKPDVLVTQRKPTLTDDSHEPVVLSGMATERGKQKLEEANRLAKLVAEGTAPPSGPEPVVAAVATVADTSVSIQDRQVQVVRELVEREPEKLDATGMPKILNVQGALVRYGLPGLSMDQVKDIMKGINAGTV